MNLMRSTALLAMLSGLVACADTAQTPAVGAGAALPQLSSSSSVEAVADHVMAADQSGTPTPALADAIPNLDRETAYHVQLETLERRLDGGDRVTGWKLGGTRITDPSAAPDPLFGYSLLSQRYEPDVPLPADAFVGGEPEVEAEITLYLGKELPGPVVTRDELIAAITGVGGAVEILSRRLSPHPADDPTSLTPNHAVADNLSHGGVILGDVIVPVSEFDFEAETAVMYINGEEAASGRASDIMGSHGDALDAVLWLANELPRHGLYLKTGDYVVTGSLYANPSVQPGDNATLEFSTLGTISFTVE